MLPKKIYIDIKNEDNEEKEQIDLIEGKDIKNGKSKIIFLI